MNNMGNDTYVCIQDYYYNGKLQCRCDNNIFYKVYIVTGVGNSHMVYNTKLGIYTNGLTISVFNEHFMSKNKLRQLKMDKLYDIS